MLRRCQLWKRVLGTLLVTLLLEPTAFGAVGLTERPANPTCVAFERPPLNDAVGLERVISDMSWPVEMRQLPEDPSRWYVVDRTGFINTYSAGQPFTRTGTFVDLRDRVLRTLDGREWGEMGLLGLAFHPNFEQNGYVYLYYTAEGPSVEFPTAAHLSRFRSNDGGLTLDPASEQIILNIDHTSQWHWGGKLEFGADGYLYLSSGNSGPWQNGQDMSTLLGKMLRIDVDSAFPYAIPPDNPFVANGGGLPEIYASGLRNPWRWSFDTETNLLYLGDVGDQSWEEIDIIEKGKNYGHGIREGAHCRDGTDTCQTAGLTDPIYEYPHDPNAAFNAVIGGFVYHGTQIPSLDGYYIFGDNFAGTVYSFKYDGVNNPTVADVLLESGLFLLSFGQGQDGEIYLLAKDGVYRMISAGATGPNNFPQTLSATGCFDPVDPSKPGPGLIPYTINSPLWSDGASKGRWMAIPDGATISINADGHFDYPIGTVLIKDFRLGGQLFETRLFMRHDDGGWAGYTYEWNDTYTDANLLETSKDKVVNGQLWTYPSRSQCGGCHTSAAGHSLGPEVAQFNGPFVYPSTGIEANQLETLEAIGMFDAPLPDVVSNLPALPSIDDDSKSLESRAKSYLHANCQFCHRPGGPGQGPEDFRYSTPVDEMGAVNELPTQGDLGIADARLLYPGHPEKSVLALRMHSLGNERMPPLATRIVDTAGTTLIDSWISSFDSVCGQPAFDKATESAVFLWQDCSTGEWNIRVTGGGQALAYTGDINSNDVLGNALPFSLESNDVLNSSVNQIDFVLNVGGSGQDGFGFSSATGADACFEVNTPVGIPILLGAKRLPMTTPFNLNGLASCVIPPSPCGEPSYDRASESALFIWQECTTGRWSVRVTAGGQYLNTIGTISSDQNLNNVASFRLEGNDVLDNSTDPKKIDYSLIVANAGQDGFDFDVPSGANTCFALENPAGLPILLGGERILKATPFDLATLGPCTPQLPALSINDVMASEGDGQLNFTVSLSKPSTLEVTTTVTTVDESAVAPGDYEAVPPTTLTFAPGVTNQLIGVTLVDDSLSGEGAETLAVNLANPINATISKAVGFGTIFDNDASPCGQPVFDKAIESAMFVWQDCATQSWHIRVTAGGQVLNYAGNVASNEIITGIAPFSLEDNDVLSFTTDPTIINYQLGVGASGQDGFDFTIAAQATSACLAMDLPAGIPVYMGSARNLTSVPFDLVTFESCN